MSVTRSAWCAVVIATAAAAGLTGCGSSSPTVGSISPAAALTSTAQPAAGGASPTASAASGVNKSTMPVSSLHIRFANFYAPKGKPGPALDIYDVVLNNLNGAPAAPIASDVAYGTVSSYVQPHLIGTFGMKTVELEALPTGENPDTQSADAVGAGGAIDDGSNAAITVVFGTDDDSAAELNQPLSGLTTSERVETGDDGQGDTGPAAPPAPAGKSELLVDDTQITQTGSLGLYLSIDGSCAPPLNGDPNVVKVPEIFAADSSTLKSSFAVFATTPGTHSVSVESWTSSTAPTCSQLTAKQGTTSVTLTSGEQAEVFLYGSGAKDLHFVVSPIASS